LVNQSRLEPSQQVLLVQVLALEAHRRQDNLADFLEILSRTRSRSARVCRVWVSSSRSHKEVACSVEQASLARLEPSPSSRASLDKLLASVQGASTLSRRAQSQHSRQPSSLGRESLAPNLKAPSVQGELVVPVDFSQASSNRIFWAKQVHSVNLSPLLASLKSRSSVLHKLRALLVVNLNHKELAQAYSVLRLNQVVVWRTKRALVVGRAPSACPQPEASINKILLWAKELSTRAVTSTSNRFQP